MNTVIQSSNYRENYNSVLETIAKDAFQIALNHFNQIVDEKGHKLTFNFEDICNSITNVSQLARREYVAKNS